MADNSFETPGGAHVNGALAMALDANGKAVPAGADTHIGIVDVGHVSGRPYELVPASQNEKVLGANGAAGDDLDGLIIVPESTSPGVVSLFDDDVPIPLFVGGSVSTLMPTFIRLGLRSVKGAWKVTTGKNVSVIAVGRFS